MVRGFFMRERYCLTGGSSCFHCTSRSNCFHASSSYTRDNSFRSNSFRSNSLDSTRGNSSFQGSNCSNSSCLSSSCCCLDNCSCCQRSSIHSGSIHSDSYCIGCTDSCSLDNCSHSLDYSILFDSYRTDCCTPGSSLHQCTSSRVDKVHIEQTLDCHLPRRPLRQGRQPTRASWHHASSKFLISPLRHYTP